MDEAHGDGEIAADSAACAGCQGLSLHSQMAIIKVNAAFGMALLLAPTFQRTISVSTALYLLPTHLNGEHSSVRRGA